MLDSSLLTDPIQFTHGHHVAYGYKTTFIFTHTSPQNWVVKFDLLQLIVLVIGILTFSAGTVWSPMSRPDGFTGYSWSTFKDNYGPGFTDGYDWIAVFSVFFPAVTGMMAGANISGELKNAQRSMCVQNFATKLPSTEV